MVDVVARDRGQVLPLVALVVLLGGLGALVLGRLALLTVDEASVRTAADAVALAAVVEPSAAEPVARANGARVVSVERVEGSADVRAVVEGPFGDVASARAQGVARPSPVLRRGLAPAMVAAIARAEQLLGRPIVVTSGYRSPAEQARLWARRDANPFPVAPPGTSMHERGLAIDVASSMVDELARVGESAGLCRPYPRTDPVHFELCPARFATQRGG